MEVSRSMREVSVNPSGNEHCRNDMCPLRSNHSAGLWRVVSRRGCGAFAECSRFLGLRLQGGGTEPERTSAFPIKVYSWWHCTTEWAPQSGREGRRYGPGWPDCTWARTERCTAPKQTCRREDTRQGHKARQRGGWLYIRTFHMSAGGQGHSCTCPMFPCGTFSHACTSPSPALLATSGVTCAVCIKRHRVARNSYLKKACKIPHGYFYINYWNDTVFHILDIILIYFWYNWYIYY